MCFLELHTISKEGQIPVYISLNNIASFTIDNISKDAVTKSLIYMNGGQIIHVIEEIEDIKNIISKINNYKIGVNDELPL